MSERAGQSETLKNLRAQAGSLTESMSSVDAQKGPLSLLSTEALTQILPIRKYAEHMALFKIVLIVLVPKSVTMLKIVCVLYVECHCFNDIHSEI